MGERVISQPEHAVVMQEALRSARETANGVIERAAEYVGRDAFARRRWRRLGRLSDGRWDGDRAGRGRLFSAASQPEHQAAEKPAATQDAGHDHTPSERFTLLALEGEEESECSDVFGPSAHGM